MKPGFLELARSAPVLMKFKSSGAIALTFDDGPDPVTTRQVLAMLKEHGAKATFFVLGRQAEIYPELLREILAAGSEIGNHSYSHPSFSGLKAFGVLAELKRSQTAIGRGGRKLFRPPYGHARWPTPLMAALKGYATVGWSVDIRDWERLKRDVMLAELSKKVRPGDIVLLHDRLENAEDVRAFDRTEMIAALGEFLRTRGRDFQFKTVSEMMETCEPIYEQAWDSALKPDEMEKFHRQIEKLKRNV